MPALDFEQIERFLGTVGHSTLFEYLGVGLEATEAEVDDALRSRRAWAQAQQSNPKHRVEALWLIKHQELVKRAVFDQRGLYLDEVERRDRRHGLEVLDHFIHGTFAEGALSPRGEVAILQRGRALGLPDHVVRERLEALMGEAQVRRREDDIEEASEERTFTDYYADLGVEPAASPGEIEAAYRARYRWARSLRNTGRATRIYDRLDAAWRVLNDLQRRRIYDQLRRHMLGSSSAGHLVLDDESTDPVGISADRQTSPCPPAHDTWPGPLDEEESLGFLSGPEGSRVEGHPEPADEVTAPPGSACTTMPLDGVMSTATGAREQTAPLPPGAWQAQATSQDEANLSMATAEYLVPEQERRGMAWLAWLAVGLVVVVLWAVVAMLLLGPTPESAPAKGVVAAPGASEEPMAVEPAGTVEPEAGGAGLPRESPPESPTPPAEPVSAGSPEAQPGPVETHRPASPPPRPPPRQQPVQPVQPDAVKDETEAPPPEGYMPVPDEF